jgi:hypothetical protein
LFDQPQTQGFNQRAFAHPWHATQTDAQTVTCVGQQLGQHVICPYSVVCPAGFKQGDGFGHGTALHQGVTAADFRHPIVRRWAHGKTRAKKRHGQVIRLITALNTK